MKNKVKNLLHQAIELHQNSFLKEAVKIYEKVLKIDPNNFDAIQLLAVLYSQIKNYEASLSLFNVAITINPYFPDLFINRGNALRENNYFEAALKDYHHAINLNADSIHPYIGIGTTYNLICQYELAVDSLKVALEFDKNNFLANLNIAYSYQELGLLDESCKFYETALTINPNYDYLIGSYLHILLVSSRWDNLNHYKKIVCDQITNNLKPTVPICFLSIEDSPKLQQVVACSFTLDRYPSSTHLPAISHKPHNRIRIAYFSSDFRSHAVSYLIAELFELHNRNCFEIYGFSLASPPPEDKMSQRLRSTFDHFYEVSERSPLEIVQLARGLEIDIAFDLNGHTQGAQTSIFAHRVAPIQINYLGYPGTMGAEYMDYIIADQHLIPPQSRPFYTEKIIYLPHSFQINDSKRKNINSKLNRLDFNLPPEGFLFCCFNNTYKINLEMLCIWSEILKNVPNSYLWLLSIASSAEDNIRNQALDLGIESRRLIFGHRLERNAYLERFQLADLFLDTLPFNGGTTISDALWAGLPVLTQTGNSFAARMGTSLLNAVNLPELIASSRDEYIRTAIELAGDSNRLSKIKQKLTKELKTSPLFNTAQFTKNFENAIQQAYEKYLTKREPEDIWVKD